MNPEKSLKLKRLSLILTLLALMIVACEKEELKTPPPVSQDVAKQIEALGFDPEGIKDLGDYYLVENDILLRKDKLYEYEPVNKITETPNGRVRHSTNGVVSLANQRNITVFVDNTVPTTAEDDWRAEVQLAIAEINAVPGSRIRLQYVTTAPADIIIRDDNNTLTDCNLQWNGSSWVCGFTLAAAEWPSSGQAGFQIRLNLNADNNRVFTTGQKQHTITHELGHCIGFVHTNATGLGEASGTAVPGTPTSGSNPDPGSFMNGGTAENSWAGFSYYDRIAFRTVYPSMSVTISGPAFGTNTGTYTWKALTPVNGIGPYTYIWHYGYDGVNYNGFFGTGTSITKPMPQDLDLYLRLTATASDGEVAVDFHTTQHRFR